MGAYYLEWIDKNRYEMDAMTRGEVMYLRRVMMKFYIVTLITKS